jgi:hypothetical protein
MRGAITLAVLASLFAGATQAAPKCASSGAAKAVEAAVRGWFSAFAREDYAGRLRGKTTREDYAGGYGLQTPGLYAYDGGKQYDGTALG